MTDSESEKITYFVMLFLEMRLSVKSIAQISALKIDVSFDKCFFLFYHMQLHIFCNHLILSLLLFLFLFF